MSSTEKDIQGFRDAQQQLLHSIFRIAFIRLILLTIVVLTFSRAVERANSSYEIAEKRQASVKASIKEDELKVLLSEVQLYKEENIQKETLPIPNANSSSETKLSETNSEKGEIKEAELRLQYNEAVKETRKLKQEYEDLLAREFTLKTSLLGTAMEFDLRLWVYLLPFLFLLTETYFQILRKKQKLLNIVAANKFGKRDDVPVIDRLFISDEPNTITPFAKYPSQFEQLLSILITLLLIGYIIIKGWEYWPDRSSSNAGQYAQVLLTITFYAAAYYFYISSKLEAQIFSLVNRDANDDWRSIVWKKSNSWARLLLSRLKSRISLTTGSLLILITLFLAMADSCSPTPGYKILLPRNDVTPLKMSWLTAEAVNYWGNIVAFIGRSTYAITLFLALLTLIFVITSFFRFNIFKRLRLMTILFIILGSISIYLILDFAFSIVWLPDSLYPLKIAVWFATIFLWCLFGLSRSKKKHSSWVKIRLVLVLLFIPLVIDACFFLVHAIDNDLIGLPVYFIGVNLLSLSYMQFAKKTIPIESKNPFE
jgi:hypothetical protein